MNSENTNHLETEEAGDSSELEDSLEAKRIRLEIKGMKETLRLCEKEVKNSRNEIALLRSELDQERMERKRADETICNLQRTVDVMNQQFSYLYNYYANYYTQQDENMLATNSLSDSAVGTQEIKITPEKDSKMIKEKPRESKKDVEKGDTDKSGDGKIETDNLVEDLEKAAEEALVQNGMVYDANSGMYYDWNSHMYYDPTTHLYYDNDNGIYYYYDGERNSFMFYSQVQIPSSPASSDTATGKKEEEKSEGELSSEEEYECDHAEKIDEKHENEVPCIRAIIKSSDALPLGTLYLITINGASIGRDKKHLIRIPGVQVSKDHATITFDKEQNTYVLQDLGSVNGTLLDGNRISGSKASSQRVALSHGNELRIGETVIALHVHRGNETCDGCEPGQVQAFIAKKSAAQKDGKSTMSRNEIRQLQIKNMKKKYNILGAGQSLSRSGKYKDRANIRRQEVGSEPILGANGRSSPKNQGASVHEEISEENVGHKMLAKMGWKSGEGLGKQRQGIVEPVEVMVREKNAGLGSSVNRSLDDPDGKNRSHKWNKARQRYNNIVANETQ